MPMRVYHRDTLGPHFSEGARLLWVALLERRDSQQEIANEIGCLKPTLNKWLYGMRRPGTSWRIAIRRKFKVPLLAWDAKPKKPLTLPGSTGDAQKATGTDGV